MRNADPTGGAPAPAVLSVPEIRDYARINAEVAQRLDRGESRVVLAGAEGQRLLLNNLRGPWRATVEVVGRAGPELAADLDAPGLTVLCRGPAADGAGRGLRAGRLLIEGDAGDVVGYAMLGGAIVVAGRSGHRAGLAQAGGILILGGPGGRLAGERQSGGRLFALGGLGPHAGRGRRGGRLVLGPDIGDPDGREALREATAGFESFVAIELSGENNHLKFKTTNLGPASAYPEGPGL